jgi:chromosome segregation ATPase
LEAEVTELRDRIASAFAEDATSSDIRSVLGDVEAARGAAEAAAESARSRALDPLTADVPAARRTMDDAVFERDRLAEVARRLAPRVAEAAAREATMRRRSELARVTSERNRLAEEMARMVEPIVQIAHLVSRIDACDREIRSLNFSHVRPVLAGASPVIATLLGEVFVWDAFHAVARLHPMAIVNKASR